MTSSIQAEMPDFEIQNTLAVFLDSMQASRVGDATLKRTAKFFGFSPDSRHNDPHENGDVEILLYLSSPVVASKDELALQLAALKPVADGLQRLRKLPPLQAWAEAATWHDSFV